MKRRRLSATERGRIEVLDTRCLLAGVADFNTDGLWDAQDLDALTMAISNGEFDLKYDLNGDLTVNTDDMSSWRAIAATANELVGPYKMGDANLDGRVDATDLNALAVNWLANTNRWSEGNFFLDGRVDASDLNALAENWLGEIPTVSGTSAPLFPAQEYEVDGNDNSLGATKMLTADFDGDGLLDLAAVTERGFKKDISVLLGKGNGAFAGRRITEVPGGDASFSIEVEAADFNRDGVFDLIVVDSRNGRQSVLLGRGDGTFDLASTFQDGRGCCRVVKPSDVNGDGFQDLIWRSSAVAIRLGMGDGTFSAPITTDVAANGLTVSDFDGDGNVDFVALTGSLIFYRGNGDGTFAVGQVVLHETGGNVDFFTTGNFNDDGNEDLAYVRGIGDQEVVVLLGVGDGSFHVQPSQLLSRSLHYAEFTANDVNGDGITDLTAIENSENTLTVFVGQVDGNFANGEQYRMGSRSRLLSHVWGDFDRDGFVDAATFIEQTTVQKDKNVVVLLGKGDGSLLFSAETDWGLNGSISTTVVEDLDDDGLADLAVFDGNDVLLFFGRGEGLFEAPQTLSVEYGLHFMLGTDFNQDGIADLLVANGESNDVSVFLNLGERRFEQQVLDLGMESFSSIETGDWNGDGSIDLAISTTNSEVDVWLGQGDGILVQGTSVPLSGSASSMTATDLNNDGILDLLAATAISDSSVAYVDILLGRGDGDFSIQPRLENENDPTMLVTADFDSDGFVDLATPERPGTLVVRLGRGDGTFEAGMTLTLPGLSPRSLFTFADFNGDEQLDVAVASLRSPQISVLLGLGNGQFGQPYSFVAGSSLNHILVVGDFDGNGTFDLAVNHDGRLSVLLNQSDALPREMRATDSRYGHRAQAR